MAVQKKSTEPKFESLATQLAEADATARTASADSNQARAARSQIATDTIKAAFAEKIPVADVRKNLLAANVLKGTVSKIGTILQALNDGVITPTDVKSLNGAYNSVKAALAATLAAAGGTPITASTPTAPTPAPIITGATTPEAALDLIVAHIEQEKDLDKRYAAVGDWLTKVTEALSKITRAIDSAEDE